MNRRQRIANCIRPNIQLPNTDKDKAFSASALERLNTLASFPKTAKYVSSWAELLADIDKKPRI